MSRRLLVLLATCVAVLILGGVGVWALPEVVRRAAVAKIPELTGRSVSVERVELNLFTGRFAITRFSMARRAGQAPEPFVQFERLAGRLALGSLLGGEIRLVELRLSRPIVRVTRTGPADFDFSDVLERLARPAAPATPSRWTLSLGRVEVTEGMVLLTDASLSPPEEWRVDGLGIEILDLSTRSGHPPGRLRLSAALGPAKLRVTSDAVVLAPASMALDVSVVDFDLARVRRYLPAELPAFPQTGAVRLDLRVTPVAAGDLGQASVSGEMSVAGLSVAQRGGTTPFLVLDRLRVAIKAADLPARNVTLDAIEADGLDVKVARDRTGRIDLLAALGGFHAPAAPAAPAPAVARSSDSPGGASAATPRAPPSAPPPGKLVLDRLTVTSARVTLYDEGVSPAREWKIQGLTVDGAGFSTSSEDGPATARVRASITARPGLLDPATFTLDADSVRVAPASVTARVSLQGLALAAIEPYWPATTPVVVPRGSIGVGMTVSVESGDSELRRLIVSGTLRGRDLTVVRRGQATPFLTIPKLSVALKQADAVAHTAALGAVEIEGADLVVARDALGRIDLLDLATVAQPAVEVVKSRTGLRVEEPSAPPTPAPAASTGPEWRVSLDRFTLAKGLFTFDDGEVSPRTSLALGDVAVLIERLSWPFTTPAALSFSVSMPGGGRTEAKGTAVLEPLNVHVALSTRDAPIEPYQAYLPFAARLRGLFSGESQNEIQRGPKGELILASRGTAWARALEVLAPGAEAPVARMAEMEIRGIDFSWPNYALVEHVMLRRPEIQIERDAQGGINLGKLFEVAKDAAPPGPAATPGVAPPEPPRVEGGGAGTAAGGREAEGTVIDFTEIEIADGYARFIDRTTTPAFSQDLSRLTLKVRDLSNVFGRPKRTTVTAQAGVGGDGVLDLRGELSGIGEALRADLVVEVHDYALPSANPYAESLTSWVIQRGKLQASIHYRLEGDRLSAEHNLDFKGLRVAKSRESDLAQRRIGVPLGLAVALLKDSHGNIDFSVPLHGSVSDRNFDWGEAMWAGVKQVVTKLLLAPFHAIGRLLTGGGDVAERLEVNPVAFPSGSSVVAPAMEAQLTRVADFLRRSPAIKLALASTVSTADAASLNTQAVTARLQEFRREHDLPDLAAALQSYYQQRLPGVAPPKTVDEQLALLAEREPVPVRGLAELAQRRLDAARERLVKGEGIPADRLAPPAAPAAEIAPAASGEGRVEFTIVEADE